MKRRDYGRLVVLAVIGGITGLGCSEADRTHQPLDKPPPPPPTASAAQTYDYTHSIQNHGNAMEITGTCTNSCAFSFLVSRLAPFVDCVC